MNWMLSLVLIKNTLKSKKIGDVIFWQASYFFFSLLCDFAQFEAIEQFEASENIRILLYLKFFQ